MRKPESTRGGFGAVLSALAGGSALAGEDRGCLRDPSEGVSGKSCCVTAAYVGGAEAPDSEAGGAEDSTEEDVADSLVDSLVTSIAQSGGGAGTEVPSPLDSVSSDGVSGCGRRCFGQFLTMCLVELHR